jgi:hypothetical protein
MRYASTQTPSIISITEGVIIAPQQSTVGLVIKCIPTLERDIVFQQPTTNNASPSPTFTCPLTLKLTLTTVATTTTRV